MGYLYTNFVFYPMKIIYALSWRLRLKLSFHAIQIPNTNLKYIPIPKNASSSMLSTLGGKIYPNHRIDCDFHLQFWHDYRNYYLTWNNKFVAIVRYPTTRFISGYQNRIREKNIDSIHHLFPNNTPCIYFFAENIKLFIRQSKDIRHHFRPQSDFIPKDALIIKLEETDPIAYFFGEHQTKKNVSTSSPDTTYDIERIEKILKKIYYNDFSYYQ